MDVVYIMPIRLKNYLRHEKIRCHGRNLSIFNPFIFITATKSFILAHTLINKSYPY
ncbi:hypothetical protein ACYDLZ_00310 [Staphylococcus succinus]|uniref:hypothetical protein n=1 Tax=Staphylococcus succinus TaxID=61015 RepID=UPI002DBC03E3|nr:hypothetical protein [Staphylococcus succinus]MEB7462978.1 hypothetical protein [Staphylococcus succinus]